MIEGGWDVHVHAAPSLFPRWGDAWELAQTCTLHKMEGVVVKSHHGSTVELASVLNGRFPHLQVLGGVTLNLFMGGLNPYAVECAMALGGKFVWLPTLHAAHHGERCGCLGGFKFQKSAVARTPSEGLRIVEGGKLRGEVLEIMECMHGRSVVLATGHISSEEIFVLLAERDRAGWDIPVLINHVFFHTPRLGLDELKRFNQENVWFETVQLCTSPLVAATTVEEVAATVRELPDARWILATDSGQEKNLPCPEALEEYARALLEAGVAEGRVRRMFIEEPRALLRLS